MREITKWSIGIKQGRISMFCQSRSIERFFFDACALGAFMAIFVTKELYSSSTLLASPSMEIQRVFTFLRILLIFLFQASRQFLKLQSSLGRCVEVRVQRFQESLYMFHHIYLGMGLDSQVSVVCNAMDTHHEQIVFVNELHYHTRLSTLKYGHSVYPKRD